MSEWEFTGGKVWVVGKWITSNEWRGEKVFRNFDEANQYAQHDFNHSVHQLWELFGDDIAPRDYYLCYPLNEDKRKEFEDSKRTYITNVGADVHPVDPHKWIVSGTVVRGDMAWIEWAEFGDCSREYAIQQFELQLTEKGII